MKSSVISKLWMQLLILSVVSASGLAALAANEVPQTFTLDGRLFTGGAGSTTPMTENGIQMKIQILDDSKTCVLYEETQTVNTLATNGYFTVQVGSTVSATKRSGDDPNHSMTQVFQNTAPISASNSGCTSPYQPTSGHKRYFHISVTSPTTHVTDVLSPDMMLDSVPNAVVADTLQGYGKQSFIMVNNDGTTKVLSQANVENIFSFANYPILTALLSGSSSQYVQNSGSGASVPSFASDPSSAPAGSLWYDSSTNSLKYSDGSPTPKTIGTAGSGVTSFSVESDLTANGISGGTINSSGSIGLNNTGVTAGTYTKVTVDAKGRVGVGTTLIEADIPNLVTPGKVSGNAINAGTIGGTAAMNTSGNITTTGTVTASNLSSSVDSTNELRLYSGTNYMTLTASPSLTGTFSLAYPDGDGASGQYMTTNGSGQLSWSSLPTSMPPSGPAGGDLAGTYPNPDLKDTGTAGSYTKVTTDAKGRVISGTIPTTLAGYSITDAVKNNGDLNSMQAGLDASKPAAGNAGAVYFATDTKKIFRDDGNAWIVMGTTDASDTSSGILSVPHGGTGTSSFTGNQMVIANGTGSALQSFFCPLDNVLSFDSSGNATCSTTMKSLNGLTALNQNFAVPGTAGTAPNWVSSGSDHTLNIPMANTASVTAGLISKTEYDTFNNKLGTTTVFAGDVSGTYNATSVDKIKGKAVTTPTASGQMLVYDGAGITPVVMSGDGTMIADGTMTLKNTGTAGTYFQVTTDAQGRVTAGANPTTLAGFGITDAVRNGGQTGAILAGTSDSNSMTFMTDNVNRMVIDATGKVGVGTATADATLHLNGASGSTLKIVDGNQGAGKVLVSDANGVATWTNPAGLEVDTLATVTARGATTATASSFTGGLTASTLTVTTTADVGTNLTVGTDAYVGGKVGIGTNSAMGALDVRGADGTIYSRNTNSSSFSGLNMYNDAGVAVGSVQVGGTTAAIPFRNNLFFGPRLATGQLVFTRGTGATEMARFDASGNFGLGTSTMTNKLEVVGTSGATLKIVDGNQGTGKILTSDANGVASWASPGSVAVTSVATGAGLTGGTITSTGTISLANIADATMLANVSGSAAAPTATTLSALIDKTSNTQGSILYRDGSNWVALAPGTAGYMLSTGGAGANPSWTNPATGITLAGDVSGAAGNNTVDKIKNVAVSATAPTATGQVLRYNNSTTRWEPSFLSMFDLRSTVTGAATFAAGCTSNQTLTWTAATDNLACANISLPVSQLQNIANNTVLANVSGSAGAPAATTLSALLDSTATNVQGSILYRNGSNWVSLAPGSNGDLLKSGGAGANPSWISASSTESDTLATVTARGATTSTASSFTGGLTASNLTVTANAGIGTNLTVGGNALIAGNVGIGTATPDSQVMIWGVGQTTANLDTGGAVGGTLLLADAVATAGSGGALIFGANNAGTSRKFAAIKGLITSGAANGMGDIALSTRTTTAAASLTEKMRITASGNVGIGTTSPGRLLHVNGPMRVTASALPGTPATGDIAVDSGDANKLKWYDGSGWQAAGGSGGGRTSCPAGFSLVGTSGSMEAYCISTNEETSATWLNAVTNCSNKTPAARLCSASEWVHACVKAGTYGISNMTGNWEWVADLYFNGGQVMGNSGCDSFSNASVAYSYGSRCCFR